jgi:hypothetical protein
MQPFAQRTVSLLLVAALVAPLATALVVRPHAAYAAVPTFETNPALTTVQTEANVIDSIKNTFQLAQDLYAWAFKIAVEALRKRLLDMLVDQIIQWIQGGGTPKFIGDWQGFLLDAVNAGVGDIVKQLGLGFLCSPFNLQIKLFFSPIPKFSQRATCTLDKIVGNIKNFYGDFRNGGWIAYQQAWKPQGNIWGAVIMVHDEALREGANRAVASAQEGVANQGFLSTKRCVRQGADGSCEKFEVTTPGKTIGDTLSRAVASDIDYIVNADDFEAYVVAIADAILNRLIREGVGGVAGLTTSNAPEGGYVPVGVSGACAGLSGAALTACVAQSQVAQQKAIADKNAIISSVQLVLTQDRVALLEKQGTLSAAELALGRLQALRACDPTIPDVDQQIAIAQLKIGTLNAEIPALASKIAAMEAFIAAVQAIPDNRPDLISNALSSSEQFGDPTTAAIQRTAAEAERQAAEALLSSATSQLALCQSQ